MNELKTLVATVQRQLFLQALLKSLLAGFAAGLLVVLVASVFLKNTALLWVATLAALVAFAVAAFRLGLHREKKSAAKLLIHQTIGNAEYSLPLLDKDELNIAERLQLDRLRSAWENQGEPVPWKHIYRGISWYLLPVLLLGAAYVLLSFIPKNKAQVVTTKATTRVPPTRLPPPAFIRASVTVTPPPYTKLPQTTSTDLHISALQGSRVTWKLHFKNTSQLNLRLSNSRGEEVTFKPEPRSAGIFEYSDLVTSSGLYAIRGYQHDSLVYQSDFFKLEAIADKPPLIEPLSKEVYRFHDIRDPQTLKVQAKMSDDFEVSEAYMVATVARGSGENVKFREVRFPLSPSHFRQSVLEKTIDLKSLNFSPGDELFYYWAATDNKKPEPNFAKSDTYFIVYKDTANNAASELATMALDIMPEYFRSQRQIIIDTKKLIAKRKKLSREAFNTTSNEIGFDQKVLRLRYGQYLGEEFETNIGGAAVPDGDEGDILASFEHKSDASEEDHFRQQKKIKKEDEHDHGHSQGHSEDKDPMLEILEQFTHSHDDEEMNTFYEESTRNMLKMALEQMWQSELHLRMFEPEKALPFETKALEFLKNAQHKVRAFVRKSGFDPPPIKENEKRLSGELKDIREQKGREKTYAGKTTAQLAALVLGQIDSPHLTDLQKNNMRAAGAALSDRLLQSGGTKRKDWAALTLMQKWLSAKTLSQDEKLKLKSALKAFTTTDIQSLDGYASENALEKTFWQSLQ